MPAKNNLTSGKSRRMPGLCVLFVLVMAAPVYAGEPCEKFFNQASANTATEYERRACMVEMMARYSESWKALPSGRLPALILSRPPAKRFIQLCPPGRGQGATILPCGSSAAFSQRCWPRCSRRDSGLWSIFSLPRIAGRS